MVTFVSVLSLAHFVTHARAQEAAGPAPEPAATTQPASEAPLASPRGTVKTFLLAMNEKRLEDAISCLDLSGIAEDRRVKKGPELAQLLRDYIQFRRPQIKLEIIPDDPDHKSADLPDAPHAFALIKDENNKAEIVITPQSDGLWRFSKATLDALPTLYEAIEAHPTATQPAVEPGVPEHLSSPRTTIRTFMDAMAAAEKDTAQLELAMQCVDLSKMSAALRADRGSIRAERLKLIIELTHEDGLIDETIPNDPKGGPYTLHDGPGGGIVVAPNDHGHWVFTADTMANVEELWKALSRDEDVQKKLQDADVELSWELWLESKMPGSLRNEWLGLEYWQWLTVLLLVLIGVLADLVVRLAFSAALKRELDRRNVQIDSSVRATFLRPLGILVMGAIWWIGLRLLVLPESVDRILLPATKVVTCLAAVWVVYRLIDLVGAYFGSVAERTESKFDDLLVPLLRRTLKIVVLVVSFVFLADVFDWELTGVLATLGIGGLAIGFAARETLQNFLGSLTVLVERPFQIGDWIKVGDIEGTVESVGFRSTRVRTFYNSLITVPNGGLLTANVDNLGARRYRRIKAMLSLTYDTPPEKIDAFCEGIRELIRRHPYTRKDYYHVYFNQFADASLNVLLYCFHETPDWATELRERHRLFNDILRLAQSLGVSFAFPTRTIHLHQEPASSSAPTPPAVGDPKAGGRKAAADIVREARLADTIPPPVSFHGPEPGGGNADDDA